MFSSNILCYFLYFTYFSFLSLESDCSDPNIAFGTVNTTGTIASGGTTEVNCNVGYKLTGTAVMTCTKGTFSSQPTCTGIIV